MNTHKGTLSAYMMQVAYAEKWRTDVLKKALELGCVIMQDEITGTENQLAALADYINESREP